MPSTNSLTNCVNFRLCINLMHILPPVTAEGYSGSRHPRYTEWMITKNADSCQPAQSIQADSSRNLLLSVDFDFVDCLTNDSSNSCDTPAVRHA